MAKAEYLLSLSLLISPLLATMAATAENGSHQCLAAHYKVVALPLVPSSISDSGQIAGTTEKRSPALWSADHGLTKIPAPPDFTAASNLTVNSKGHVSGLLFHKDSVTRQAFYYADGKLVLLPSSQSKAFALNNEDLVVGESVVDGKATVSPVLWRDQTPVVLGGCCGGAATAINTVGQVTGNFYDQAGHYHAFLWDKNTGIQPIAPEVPYSSGIAINSKGHVLVDAFSARYIYADGKLSPMKLAPKFPSHPRAMNDCDVVVGSFGPHADRLTAFSWEAANGFYDLNQRIPIGSGWKLEAATGINNRGEIVGWGDHAGNDDAGFLLLPKW